MYMYQGSDARRHTHTYIHTHTYTCIYVCCNTQKKRSSVLAHCKYTLSKSTPLKCLKQYTHTNIHKDRQRHTRQTDKTLRKTQKTNRQTQEGKHTLFAISLAGSMTKYLYERNRQMSSFVVCRVKKNDTSLATSGNKQRIHIPFVYDHFGKLNNYLARKRKFLLILGGLSELNSK